MDEFKIENFNQIHPEKNFPACRQLGAGEVLAIRSSLESSLGMKNSPSGLDLVKAIASATVCIEGEDALNERFSLQTAIESALNAPLPKLVFLNWYRFTDLDEFCLADLSMWFRDIWYPSSDDLDIVDPRGQWIASISHHGSLSILKL